jgi:hypothetical protein
MKLARWSGNAVERPALRPTGQRKGVVADTAQAEAQ